jgi:uncharacterized iron-regulated membrane protein
VPTIRLRAVIRFLHLWLGLITGVIVTIVCVTGAIYSFESELQDFLFDYRSVKDKSLLKQPYLSPSTLIAAAEHTIPQSKADRVYYVAAHKTAFVRLNTIEGIRYEVYICPYTAQIKHVENPEHNIFEIVAAIHTSLLIPEIGKQIVAWSVVIFVISLLSGIFLWFPPNLLVWKSAKGRASRLLITFRKGSKRGIYDWHNVGGFYAFFVLLVIALTGLSISFIQVNNVEGQIFNQIDRWSASTTTTLPTPEFIIDQHTSSANNAIDSAFFWVKHHFNHKGSYAVILPEDSEDYILIRSWKETTKTATNDYFYFEQNPLRLDEVEWAKHSTWQARIDKINYDLHTGSFFGGVGRWIFFLVALFGSTLPLTGFLIWKNKQYKF